MAKIPAIFARYDDNILLGAAITSTVAPLTSYALTTLALLNPAARVRFGTGTVTITFTIPSRLGDVFVLPMHNLDPGSTFQLTNGAGFSHAITVPPKLANGFPPTIVVDLTLLAGTRTSTVWNLVITGNSVNVILGGCVAIYGPKRSLLGVTATDNFEWGYKERETDLLSETTNEYGSDYTLDYGAVLRQIEVNLTPTDTGITTVRDCFRGSHGRALPSLFWPDPNVVDASFGRWQKTFEATHAAPLTRPVVMVHDERSKGEVL